MMPLPPLAAEASSEGAARADSQRDAAPNSTDTLASRSKRAAVANRNGWLARAQQMRIAGKRGSDRAASKTNMQVATKNT
eukprot:8323890-Pyramimonas_sp.AAC.2